MKISTIDEPNMRIKRTAILDDGPVVPMAYSSTGKRFRVERVTVEYHYKDGKWVIGSHFAVDMSGTVLKKDDTDSKNWHTSHPKYDYKLHAYPPRYAFAMKIVDMLRPQGGVSMIGYLEHEVNA